MPYTIGFNPQSQIVDVVYSGTVSLDERKKAVEDVCAAHVKPLKILIDVRKLTMHLSLQEQQTFGKHLAKHPGLINARVAVLHEPSHNPNLLIDATAFNNGYMLAQFNTPEDAEVWLLK